MQESFRAAARIQLAQRGLIILGERAVPSLPALVSRLTDWRHPQNTMLMMPVFYSLGQAGLPALAGALTNQTLPLQARRHLCLMMTDLSYGATNADGLLPALICCLDEPEFAVSAVQMLEGFKRHPPLALPVLAACLTHTNAEVRSRAAMALGFFGTNAAVVITGLECATNDPVATVRQAATATLRGLREAYPPGPGN
jgi:hypothetical protein